MEKTFVPRDFTHSGRWVHGEPLTSVLNRAELGATRIREEIVRKEAAAAFNSDETGDSGIDAQVEQSTAAA